MCRSVALLVKRNGREIFDDVSNLLTRADGFIQDASKFLEDEKEARKSCFNGLCPNLKSRYQLSRAARKKAGDAVQIHGDGHFETVSYRTALQEIRSAPSEALESRMLVLNQVMEALREENINKIRVWGLGGVGKSVGFMCIKANISLRITIYIYCQLIRNLKGHTQKIILGLKQN